MGFGELGTALDVSVPFSANLRKQHGLDVTCLPYTSTPFALEEVAKSLSFSHANITDTLRFNPTTAWSDIVSPSFIKARYLYLTIVSLDIRVSGPRPCVSLTV